jgi:AP endonuclease-1
MPPKKATAATKTVTKAKSTKRQDEKETAGSESKEEVPEKKVKTNAGKKKLEKENTNEEMRDEKISENKVKAKRGKRKIEQENSDIEEKTDKVPQKKAKAKSAKKRVAKENSDSENNEDEEVSIQKVKANTTKADKKKPEDESDTSKKKLTKSKKAQITKTEMNEDASTSNVKKSVAVKGSRVKKADNKDTHDTEDKPSDIKKKRKSPKTKQDDEPNTKTVVRTNATLTNWEAIDFTCTSKTAKGNPYNFHITSWNVDGLRAWLKKGGLNILKYDDPDIFCIQETKCGLEKLPEEISNIKGYESLFCSSEKEGYAGVGIITKIKPINVIYGINSEEHDNEGRCITAEFEKFFLVNVYVPNAGRKLITLPKRLEWNKIFKAFIKNLDERKPVIVCGDMNVAHKEIDLANPKSNTKNAGFTVEEREGMTDFLEDGYIDTFRQFYPEKDKAYTFWTYMSNSRSKNVGWRLDYFLVSQRFMDNVCDNIIFSEVLGSDHCPLGLFVKV